jgi:hypothetical protein
MPFFWRGGVECPTGGDLVGVSSEEDGECPWCVCDSRLDGGVVGSIDELLWDLSTDGFLPDPPYSPDRLRGTCGSRFWARLFFVILPGSAGANNITRSA